MHGTLWKTVTLRLHQARLPMEAWERQLNPPLSNLRFLVCRSTGHTPHTLFLGFSRRSPFLDLPIASHPGNLPNPSDDLEPSVPGWMQKWAEALLGRAVHTKEGPLVDPVVIQEVISPNVVRVLRPSGLEETVSSRWIEPYPWATETKPVAVVPSCTAAETKAPKSLDVQDQPMSPETLPPEVASPSEQGHPIPISETLIPPNRTPPNRTPPNRIPPTRIPPNRTPPTRTPPTRSPTNRTHPNRIPPTRTPPNRTPPNRTPPNRTRSGRAIHRTVKFDDYSCWGEYVVFICYTWKMLTMQLC